MWMKDTRAMGVSGTVLHRHKYISNPFVTPEDVVLSAAGKLAEALKGQMPQHLHESSLDKLKRLGTIFQHAASGDPVEDIDPPATSVNQAAQLPYFSTRLATKVIKNG